MNTGAPTVIRGEIVSMYAGLYIDLLKNGEHVGTTKFIDAMYSIGLYPLIDKPSRITQYSATLIDNIFYK